MLEFEEFVWLLGALAAQANAEAGGGGALSLKSVEELKADRLREEQQVALQLRGNTLRLKVDALTKASQVLHLERPLVCAQLLLRLHLAELAEAAALTTHETGGGKNAALASGKFVPLLNRIWPIAVDLEFNGPAVPSAGAAAREPSLLSLLLGTIQNYICGSIEAKKR